MSFYQAVAENGPSVCQGSRKLVECSSSGPNSLAGLTPADGIILSDGHPGNPILRLRSINPSLIRSADLDRVHLNQKLDPFDPKNGYNPTGSSTYSEKFKELYFERQAEQMNHLIDLALDRLQQINAGKDLYTMTPRSTCQDLTTHGSCRLT